MGVAYSHNKMRCFMKVQAVTSVVLFGSSLYMFFMSAYYSTKNIKFLAVVLGVLASIVLIGSILTALLAITIWKELKNDDVKMLEKPERRVRFASQEQIYAYNDQSINEENSEILDHVYEEIQLGSNYHERSIDDQEQSSDDEDELGLHLNSLHANSARSSSEVHQSLAADRWNKRQNSFRDRNRLHLESGTSYRTYGGRFPLSFNSNTDVFEEDDGEEIII